MRQDQFEKLQHLEEKLLDVFIGEADPESWPGQGLKIGAMDAKTRGDLYWVRKTAASVLMLHSKVASTIGATQAFGAGTTPAADGDDAGEQQLDKEIATAEREAARLLDELQRGTKKQAFDRKVHGKA